MIIRNLQKSDLLGLLNLIEGMVDYHHEIDGYYKAFSEYKTLEEDVKFWLNDKDTRSLVAEDNGKLVGYLRAGVERAPDYAIVKKIGIIYDAFVSEKYRKRGIARQLLNEALKWFEIKKAKNIELSVDVRNEAGIRFWKSAGFKEYKFRMRFDL
ncbi:MAG: GNAT family N-acetyltransferase [Candidatus Harrisonbacteria bacterium]|nr:GNAT family N-acetyltransferase [Candidatus Harrisonbacteria bacterium]